MSPENILAGHQLLIPINSGKPDFDPLQQVFYAEFHGRCHNRVSIWLKSA